MIVPDISGISEGIKQTVEAAIQQAANSETVQSRGKVAISLSESDDITDYGLTSLHVQDAFVELVRYLLACDYDILYGGDLRVGGYTRLLSELARLYSKDGGDDRFRIANYFSWPVHLKLSRADDVKFLANQIEVKKMPAAHQVTDQLLYVDPDTLPNRMLWAHSLTLSRMEINTNANAVVFIGGSLTNFKGRLPGVLEEYLLARKKSKPTFLCGAFGGMTRCIINILTNTPKESILEQKILSNHEQSEFYTYWNTEYPERFDYLSIAEEIADLSLEELSAQNGLSLSENLRLFSTPHLPEITYLILKGLSKLDQLGLK